MVCNPNITEKYFENNRKCNYQPFIKWVGGKRGLLSQIIPLLPQEFNNYHEAFLGGGALFFELFSQGKLKDKKIYLSDINSELINAYNVVKNNPTKLIKELETFKQQHNKEFYYQIRELDRKEDFKNSTPLERATRFIYLNKTCFNGLYRVNSKGYFNTPIGSYKNPNIADRETIYNASEALANATITHQSYKEVLKYANKDDLVYFDPPYHPLTKTSSFTSYSKFAFLEKEQIELFDTFNTLADKEIKLVKSNSDTTFIKELYEKYNINLVQANRFINSNSMGRGKISEILIRSFI